MAAMGRDVEMVTIAETTEPARGAKGLRVLPDHSFETAPTLDVVLVPGGQGSRAQMRNPVLLDWLRDVAPGCSWVTSVCTGSAILHEPPSAGWSTTPPRPIRRTCEKGWRRTNLVRRASALHLIWIKPLVYRSGRLYGHVADATTERSIGA